MSKLRAWLPPVAASLLISQQHLVVTESTEESERLPQERRPLESLAAAWTTDTPPSACTGLSVRQGQGCFISLWIDDGPSPPPAHPLQPLSQPKFEGFLAAVPKPRSVMNDKPLSQIDFKLNQTLVFNYLSRCSRRGNLKVAAKERKTEKKKERGGRVWEWGAAECEEREGRRTVGAECK